MPTRALKTLNFAKRIEIVNSSLAILKREIPTNAYNHIERLLKDGTERDVIFLKGISTGVRLAALDKKDIQEIVILLQKGASRDKNGGGLLQKSELNRIDSILKIKFPLETRRKVLTVLSRADGVLLDGLVEILKRT